MTPHRKLSDISDCFLRQARQRADVFVGDVCHRAKKFGTGTARTGNHATTATNTTGPIPMDFPISRNLIEKGVDTSIFAQVS